MKHILTLESFSTKKYTNINNYVDGEAITFYQVPFSICTESGTCIKGIDDWQVCITDNFVYNYISDDDIKKSLNKDLSKIDIEKDWTNFSSMFDTDSKNIHSDRIAKLVMEIKKNVKIRPVVMYFDVNSFKYDIKNHIEDGNHRIRALQYLNYDYFPAFISGSHSKQLIEFISNNSF